MITADDSLLRAISKTKPFGLLGGQKVEGLREEK